MPVQFRVDPKTKSLVKITESQASEDELRNELQQEADNAQNRLNAANEALELRVAEHAAIEEALLNARQEVEDATEEVLFSASRVNELNEAVRLRDELAESDPESENAISSDEGVEIPVAVSNEAQA